MTVFQALVYGVVQGLGEFLPISSSAHLIVAPWLFGWKDPGLAFDVALHLGTLAAVVVFFWREWIRLLRAGLKGAGTNDGKLFWYLVIATIPGALIGKLLEDQAESAFRNPGLIGAMLIIMGIILYVVDKRGGKEVTIENIGFTRSLLIGLSQAVAIIPGVSRSGITMSTGLLTGLTRESTARFSFLLSTPIILGAGLLKIKDLFNGQIDTFPFMVGIVTSAVVGLLSIKFLLDYLRTKGFGIFVWYRLAFGALLISLYIMGPR
ncbi:MAG TPA: undecaprenyl-diphosphatase UppP [Bacillota bacterium]|nr:undecaprenyl-diphosphatase UppP [Bacillota bacterium]